MRHIVFIALCAVISGLSACSGPSHRQELARIGSPDGELAAILIQSSRGGKPGEVWTELCLNEQVTPPDLKRPALSTSQCEPLALVWQSARTLEVHYRAPCSIDQFVNRWYQPSDLARGKAEPVEIILIRDRPSHA
jgi:hypothetical protein